MYSSNAAYEAGRRVGRRYRDHNPSDQELINALRREVGPQIRPQNGLLARRAAEHRRSTVAYGVITVLFAAWPVGMNVYWDAEWMPDVVTGIPQELFALPVVLFGALSTLAWFVYLVASSRARKELRDLRRTLLKAAHQGALDVVSVVRPTRPSGPKSGEVPRAVNHTHDDSASMTPRDAEHLAAQWMRWLGATDAEVTQSAWDGGVDVTSSRYIAQVKRFATRVGVAPIRELSGVVRLDGRRGLFFTTTGYSKGAMEFADSSGIALFVMDGGRLTAVNDIAQAFMKHKLEA